MQWNKIWKTRKYFLLCSLGILGALALTACQGTEKVDVIIEDQYTETRLSVPVGETVAEALEDAEIQVGKEDVVEPSVDEKIAEGTTEITLLRHADATLEADGDVIPLDMTGEKVKDALEENDITLGEHDLINHEEEAYVTDGMDIVVERRVEVTLTADGESTTCLAEEGTVEDFLEAQGITLGKKDRVKPKLSKQLKEDMKIVVNRVDVKKVTETETIPYGTQTKNSSSMTSGTSKVTRQGVNGEKEVTYEVTYVDGKEESRKVVKEEITKEAVDQIVTKGTKQKGPHVVSKEKVYDCDGSGHGYYIIKYSDGTVKYVDF
jgi:uncharacterized protein YabE (DUF348 family)